MSFRVPIAKEWNVASQPSQPHITLEFMTVVPSWCSVAPFSDVHASNIVYTHCL
jgi:hypothetical protein